MNQRALTDKQATFVRQYLVDGNGKQAAIRAGYSVKSSEDYACQLLRKPQVRHAVNEGYAAAATRLVFETHVTKARVVAMTLQAIEGAREAKAYGQMIRGAELLAKLHGHIVDRKDVRVIRSLQDLTDEELAALQRDVQALEAAEALAANRIV